MVCVVLPARLSPMSAQRVEGDAREVLRAAEQRRHRGGEPERRRIEEPFVLPDVRLAELLPAGAEVPQRIRALRPGVVVGDAVVLAEQEVAGRDDAVDLAVDRVARLAAVVARVAREQPLLVGDAVIERVDIGVEVVVARVRRRRSCSGRWSPPAGWAAGSSSGLLRDRVDPVRRDDVAGETAAGRRARRPCCAVRGS